MRITARVDYAILALFELAQGPPGERMQAREIARRQRIPLRFLEQILNQLKKAGLVTSIRGKSGGYLLGRLASRITLKDVVEAVEGDCGLLDRNTPESTVVRVWREIEREFLEKLESVSVRDLVKRKIEEDRVILYHI